MEIDKAGLVEPKRIEVAGTSEDGKSAEFVMEPLERGFGHTLGNAMRRVLLSSLRGSAVWGLRSNGVLHEHATIQSVVEDVHQVVHNLKALVLTLDEGVEDAVLRIDARKAGQVTAGAIQAPPSVTIHDPEQHILTLQDDHELEIELYVRKGRGFELADQMATSDDDPVGLIRIDAIYNPVLRANFTVQDTRVGQRTDYDKLTVRVETNGALDPREAIFSAAALVQHYLGFMLQFEEGLPPAPPVPAMVPAHIAEVIDRPINDVAELKVRWRNLLLKASISTLRELVARSREEVLDIENLGEKSVDEIVSVLAGMDLRLGMNIPPSADD